MTHSPAPHPIIHAARSWLGTRFQHQGRVKRSVQHHGGCDCLGLLLGVAEELDLRSRDGSRLAALLIPAYGHAPDSHLLKAQLTHHLLEVSKEAVQSGDIGLFCIDGSARHLGIMAMYDADSYGLIHAYAPARRVVEHRMDAGWWQSLDAVYRVV